MASSISVLTTRSTFNVTFVLCVDGNLEAPNFDFEPTVYEAKEYRYAPKHRCESGAFTCLQYDNVLILFCGIESRFVSVCPFCSYKVSKREKT